MYWHAPTAPIKQLIDRITELTDVPTLKLKARAFANKKAFVLTTSESDELCPIFDGFSQKSLIILIFSTQRNYMLVVGTVFRSITPY